MDSPGAILNGLGLLGIIASILLGFALLLIQPFWALLDCLRSRRGGESNSLWLIALFLTWGLGSFVYGLFLTRSRVFRVFTVSSVLLPLAILVAGALSVMKGSPMAWAEFQERERVEAERLMADFRPAVTSDPLAPIPAIDFVHGSMAPRTAALTHFTHRGPEPEKALDIDAKIRHIAHDAKRDRYYAATTHAFGILAPSTGEFTAIEIETRPGDSGWPIGIAFDTKRDRLVIAYSYMMKPFFVYDPSSTEWERLPAKMRNLPVSGLTYSPDEDCLYALEKRPGTRLLNTVHRFGPDGSRLGQLALSPPVPVRGMSGQSYQLQYGAGKLVVLLPPLEPLEAQRGRMFLIDPSTGAVSVSTSYAED